MYARLVQVNKYSKYKSCALLYIPRVVTCRARNLLYFFAHYYVYIRKSYTAHAIFFGSIIAIIILPFFLLVFCTSRLFSLYISHTYVVEVRYNIYHTRESRRVDKRSYIIHIASRTSEL